MAREHVERSWEYFGRFGDLSGWSLVSAESSGVAGIRDVSQLCYLRVSDRPTSSGQGEDGVPFRVHPPRPWTNAVGWFDVGVCKPGHQSAGVWAIDRVGRIWTRGSHAREVYRHFGLFPRLEPDEFELRLIPQVSERWSAMESVGGGWGMIQRADGKLGWWDGTEYVPRRPGWLGPAPRWSRNPDAPERLPTIRVAETVPRYEPWRGRIVSWTVVGCMAAGAAWGSLVSWWAGLAEFGDGDQRVSIERASNPLRFWLVAGAVRLGSGWSLLAAVMLVSLARVSQFEE